jgi:hypothetical protein
MQLIPEAEKDILRSMSDACIGPAVGRDYTFSKLGKFITKAQIAYFTSEPSSPLADGLKNQKLIVCWNTLKPPKRSLIIHCGMCRSILERRLLFPVLMSIENKDLPKPITPMIQTSANQEKVLRHLETTPGCINKPGFLLQLLGQASMTFAHSTSSQRYFTATAPAIPTTQTIIY